MRYIGCVQWYLFFVHLEQYRFKKPPAARRNPLERFLPLMYRRVPCLGSTPVHVGLPPSNLRLIMFK